MPAATLWPVRFAKRASAGPRADPAGDRSGRATLAEAASATLPAGSATQAAGTVTRGRAAGVVEALKDGRLSKDSTLFAVFFFLFCFFDQRVCDNSMGGKEIFVLRRLYLLTTFFFAGLSLHRSRCFTPVF